jgi:hypothetical protein
MFTGTQFYCYLLLKRGKPFFVIQRYFWSHKSLFGNWQPATIVELYQYAKAYKSHLVEKRMIELRREVEREVENAML